MAEIPLRLLGQARSAINNAYADAEDRERLYGEGHAVPEWAYYKGLTDMLAILLADDDTVPARILKGKAFDR